MKLRNLHLGFARVNAPTSVFINTSVWWETPLHHCPWAGVLPDCVWNGDLALKTGIAMAARGQAQGCSVKAWNMDAVVNLFGMLSSSWTDQYEVWVPRLRLVAFCEFSDLLQAGENRADHGTGLTLIPSLAALWWAPWQAVPVHPQHSLRAGFGP